jgi:hypothetical protein
MRPLSGLESVDWDNLEHAYGPAGDVPDALRALRSAGAEERDDARDGLANSLDHQGVQRGPATLEAVPFLIGLLADGTTPERGALAQLLAEFTVGDTCWFLHDGFHPELQTAPDHCARPQSSVVGGGAGEAPSRAFPSIDEGHDMTPGHGLAELYAAIAEGVPVYLRALDGGDEELRQAIPFLLAFLTTRAADSAPPLARLVERDPVAAVRASAALGLSHVAKRDPGARGLAVSALQSAWKRAATPLERRCIALALVRVEDPKVSAAVRGGLAEELAKGIEPVIPGAAFPWRRVDSAPFVFCMLFLGTDEAERDPVVSAACAGLAHVSDADDAADLALWLVDLRVTDAEELPPAARVALESIAGNAPLWEYGDVGSKLEERGLPGTRDELREWLDG